MSKKYYNPINKPVMVAVPRWEYAALIAKGTVLEVIETIIKNDKKYVAADVLEMLIAENEEDEDGQPV